jgi:hypothetical protein
MAGGGIPGRDPVERFTEKIAYVDSDTGCVVWGGATNSKGYGLFGWGGKGKNVLAHRWASEHLGGVVPEEGLLAMHKCKNRKCVNPEHLEFVTAKQHVGRGDSPPGFNSRATSCIHGHALSGSNLRIRSDGRRVCIECNNRHLAAMRSRAK